MLHLVSRPICECYICRIAQAKGSALSGIKEVQTHQIVLKSSKVTPLGIKLCPCCAIYSFFARLDKLVLSNHMSVYMEHLGTL